jgi:hypothetical protein
MAKATRVFSTPPTATSKINQPESVDATRRRFLAVAAGASVVSVGTLAVAAAMPGTGPGIAACAVDPIFIYGALVTRRLRAMGIRDKPTAPASPWQNGFAERLIGSIRRECMDHIVVLGEAHLCRVLRSYAGYYNVDDLHDPGDRHFSRLSRFHLYRKSRQTRRRRSAFPDDRWPGRPHNPGCAERVQGFTSDLSDQKASAIADPVQARDVPLFYGL